jgi:internalin A
MVPQLLQNSAWSEAEAQSRIEAARRNKGTALDLSSLRLRVVPESILDLSDLRELRLNGNWFREVPDVIRDLPSISHLDLSDNRLLELPGWLNGLWDLAWFDISDNQLVDAPVWLGDRASLRHLGLAGCGLIEVPLWVCDLAELTELVLSRNSLTSLPEWLGDHRRLTWLELRSNHLRSVPESLSRLTQLTRLDLSYNRLRELPEWIGQGFRKLIQLGVGGNHLTDVPSWIGALTELEDLDISQCELSQIPGFIADLPDLTKLNLAGNGLSEIPDWLGNLAELTQLTLSNNRLHSVPDSLSQLTRLRHLDLGRNKLRVVPECVGRLGDLTVLRLGRNQFAKLPAWLGNLTRLTEIDLTDCHLTEVPEWLSNLSVLTDLDISDNNIDILPEWIGNLTDLRSLWIRNNHFRTLPESLKGLINITSLNLIGNPINGNLDFIEDLKSLTELYLTNIDIGDIPQSLGSMSGLEHLMLKGKVDALPDWLRNLTDLVTLYLDDNQIASIPDWIADFSRLTVLNLSNNKLKTLPDALGGLTRIEFLVIGSNHLETVPDAIRTLTRLRTLDLSSNKLAEIPDWLSGMKGLRRLLIGNNRLSDIPPWIWSLTGLTHLHVGGSKIAELPESIANLADLEFLTLSANNLTEIPQVISHLGLLRSLNINSNHIQSIPGELSDLQRIVTFYLANNRLKELPDWLLDLPELENLSISGNPLISPPPEIVASGTGSVLAFLRARRGGSSRQWVSKLLVVGEGGVGKTSLIKALLGAEHDPAEPTTHAIQLSSIMVQHPDHNDIQMKLSTWDFGGQEIYHATHQFFLTDRSLFLLLWNARLGWEQGKLEYWLDIIRSRAPESPVLLVATHADASQRPVDLPLTELKRDYPQVVGNMIVDNQTRTGLDELRTELARRAADLPLMGAEWPTTWLNAAEAVNAFPANHITPDQMWHLMADAGVTHKEHQRYLAVAMHQLGDILYYNDDPELEQTVVLRPDWVNEYISLILDSKAVDARQGQLAHSEMTRLWASLDRGMRDHFLGMMDKYEISFRVDGGSTGVVSLVVERLPWNPPPFEGEWERLASVPSTQEIRVRYQLNTTPPGIPTWFIARSHRFTTSTHWRTGALLAHPDGLHKALVRAQPRRNTVELTVRGPSPAAFFSILDDGFNQTLLRYPGLEIKRLVPCPCQLDCTEVFDYADLQRRLTLNPPRHEIECRKSLDPLNVPRLLLGLAPSERDSARAGIERLTAMVDGLVSSVAEQSAKVDGLTAGLASEVEYMQRMFLKLLRLTQETQEVRCPSVFAVVPVKARITGATYEIRLYCEEPGAWHPLSGTDGRYPVSESAEWLRKIRPHLRKLLAVLKHVAPLASPVLGMAVAHVSDRLSAEVEAMAEVIDQIPELSQDPDYLGKNDHRDPDPAERATAEADFRALESLLIKLDPERRWGGLSRTITPEGLTLYLCRHHADAYRRATRL